jgi:putative transposase
VKLVISDAHEGIKAAVSRVLSATWQRCRVHFMRNALVHAGKTQRRVVSAFVGTAFAQDDEAAAKAQWRQVADQLRPRVPKLSAFMDEAEADVLAFMSFPKDHRTKIHSTRIRIIGVADFHTTCAAESASRRLTREAQSPTPAGLRA